MSTIKIGGRIKSVATGGIVAGANAIYDDSLSKSQQAINAEIAEFLSKSGEYKSHEATPDGADLGPVTSGEKYIWNQKYSLPETGIPTTDLAQSIRDSLTLADSSIQSVSITSGTENGTVALTVNGTITDNIAVKGLGNLAYKSLLGYNELGYEVSTTTVNGKYADDIVLDGTKPIHVITLTGNVSSVTLSENPAIGHSTHVIFKADSEFTVTINHNPINSICPNFTDLALTVSETTYAEIDFLNADNSIYVRSIQ